MKPCIRPTQRVFQPCFGFDLPRRTGGRVRRQLPRPDRRSPVKKFRKSEAGLYFAWAGGIERGDPHYYRIQTPAILIEYDDTQNNANHIHSVRRDSEGDFGLDLLADHYKASHK